VIKQKDSLIRLMNFLLSLLLILTYNPLYPIWGKCTINIELFGEVDISGCSLNEMLSDNYLGSGNKTLALITAVFVVVSFVLGLLSFSTYFRYKENKIFDVSWQIAAFFSLVLILIFFSNYPMLLAIGILFSIIYLFSTIFKYWKCRNK